MGSLLLERDLRESEEDSDMRRLARARTLVVLDVLGSARQNRVLRFLEETELIQARPPDRPPIISLKYASLRDFKLIGKQLLRSTDLTQAGLTRAERSAAHLQGTNLSLAQVGEADLRDAHLNDAKLNGAYLYDTDLSGADMSGADLSDAEGRFESGARMKRTSLDGADLSGVDLTNARITEEQLREAESLEGATMPDGRKYEDWLKDKEGRMKTDGNFLSLFPALERALDLNGKGPLTLLTHYQTPAQLRRAGHKRVVATYLRNRGVKGSANVARKALSAADSQSVIRPAQEVASRIVAELAEEVLAFKERIGSIDEQIGQRFFARPEARILRVACRAWDRSSGPCFLVCVGDVSAFESADRLAAYAGLVPAARDSGKRVGNRRILGEEVIRPSKGSSTRQRLPVCVVHRSPELSTTAREPRARSTPRLSSRWRVGGSTCCGRCCVTEAPSRLALPLDIFIEILPRTPVNRPT
jgi:hypothetical protein